MIIANYQVHSTLRAYGQQLAERGRLSKVNPPKNVPVKDQVVISSESKKRLMAEKVATQIIGQLGDGAEPNDTTKQVLNRLGQEYGRPLRVENKNGRRLVFKVLDGTSPDGVRDLSPEETDRLERKLFEIAHSIVYNNMG